MRPKTEPRGWFSLFCRLLGVLGWTYWVLLIGFIANFIFQTITLDKIDVRSETTSAEILSVTYFPILKQRVTLGYTVDGTAYETSYHLALGVFDQDDVGSTVEIRYLPDDPGTIDIGDSDRMDVLIVNFGLTALLLLASPVVAFIFARRTSRAIATRNHGERVEARVVGHVDHKGFCAIVWREPDGQEGETMTYLEEVVKEWAVGDAIFVYRLGKEGWWEEDVGPCLADRPRSDGSLPATG